jgi:hypothetical protein
MAQAINTSFDQTVEEDVLLEQLDGQAPAVQTTLKNAENVYKSFLYLRKMYSEFPARKTIIDMQTASYTDYTVVEIPTKTNMILVNNYSGQTAGIKINSGEYILQPGEKQEFPLICPDTTVVPAVAGDVLELKGDISYIMENVQDY